MAQTTYEDPVHVIELTPEFLKNYYLDIPTVATAGLSSVQLAQLLREMRVTGRALVKEYRGKYYLLLKGRAGLRPNLTGTRYALTNPKMIAYGIGVPGQVPTAIEITIIGFILAAGIEIMEAILNDRTTLAEFFGGLATELTKAAAAGLAGAVATLGVGQFFAVVAGTATPLALPAVVGILVSVAAGAGLTFLDREFHISERVSAVIQDLIDATAGKAARLNGQIERGLIEQAMRRAGTRY